MDTSYMEVRFDKYCSNCKHSSVSGTEEPCSSCIGRPVMFGTDKPKNYEERINYRRYNAKKTVSTKGGKENGKHEGKRN